MTVTLDSAESVRFWNGLHYFNVNGENLSYVILNLNTVEDRQMLSLVYEL